MASAAKSSIPLLELPGASQAFQSSDDFAALLSRLLPLRVNRWDAVAQQSFVNHAGVFHLNGLSILSTLGTGVVGDVEQQQDAQLIIAYGSGNHHYRLEQRDFRFSDAAVFLPATQNRVRINSSICSAVVINVAPDSLMPIAEAMAGPACERLSLRSALEQPALLCRYADPRRRHLLAMLEQTILYIEQCLMIGGGLHPILQLDDLIRRLIVMLLLPDLFKPAAEEPLIGERFVHQDLIDWLLAHLHEPISLSSIEARSHYSRRSLQLAFKKRFGCGPMQWLRRQRLAKARALLETPGAFRSLQDVSLACGYLSTASFSRDYLARYGERPSQHWRRLRQTP